MYGHLMLCAVTFNTSSRLTYWLKLC